MMHSGVSKNPDKNDHAEARPLLQRGVTVARRSTMILVTISIVEGIVGAMSGSIALLADATHTVVDIAGSAIVWLGLRLSLREPTDQFPYGFYKAESICTLIVCIIMLITAAEIIRDSAERLFIPSIIELRLLVIAVALGSGIVSYFLAQYKERAGRDVNSQGLRAESKHSMADVFSSGLVCASVLFTYVGIAWIEPLAAIAISVFIAWAAFRFGKDSIISLMDVSTSPEMRNAINKTIAETPSVMGVHALKVRRSGPFIFVEAHVEIDGKATVERAHAVVDEVEERIRSEFSEVDSITIHIGMMHSEKNHSSSLASYEQK